LGFAEILQFTQSVSEHEILDKIRWFGSGANTKEHKLIDDPIGLEFSTNVQFTTVQVAASKNPTYELVQEHLTETLGKTPNTFVHSSYDAVWVIGLAILLYRPHGIFVEKPTPTIPYKGNSNQTGIKKILNFFLK